MAGTVKLTTPPALPVGGVLAGGAEAVECAGVVAVTGDFVTAGCVAAGEVAAVEGGDAGAELAAVATAPTEPPEAGPDAAVDGVDPVPPHALRPAPPMTAAAAMITTGTRRILMPLPFIE
jgi:hypothetical protein